LRANGPTAGTAFSGGPQTTGPIDGLRPEKARIPFANVGLVKLPDEVSDDGAILLSDIFPTGCFRRSRGHRAGRRGVCLRSPDPWGWLKVELDPTTAA